MQAVARKVALFTALAAGSIGGLAALLRLVPFGFVLLLSIVAGVAAYILVRRYVVVRLVRIESALTELLDERGSSGVDRATAASSKPDAGDELDRLSRRSDKAVHAVKRRLAELNRAEDYRREYIGDVSHELKTPIFAIQGFAETLLNGALDDPTVSKGFVEKILQNATRLNTLARDLSEIARLEGGTLEDASGRFSIGDVMKEVKESFEIAAGRKDVALTLDVQSDNEVQGDRERIRQVLTNLVDNAIKYNEPGGWVRLAVRRLGGAVVISIQDNGIGIAPLDIPRVTQRFFRTDRSRSRAQGGSGLGLSIVKHILVAHRTSLRIESEPGTGSTFEFELPVA